MALPPHDGEFNDESSIHDSGRQTNHTSHTGKSFINGMNEYSERLYAKKKEIKAGKPPPTASTIAAKTPKPHEIAAHNKTPKVIDMQNDRSGKR